MTCRDGGGSALQLRAEPGRRRAGYAHNGLTFVWAYDPFGNRKSQTVSGSSQTTIQATPSFTFIAASNHVDNGSYDAMGNMTHDQLNSYAYDAGGGCARSARRRAGPLAISTMRKGSAGPRAPSARSPATSRPTASPPPVWATRSSGDKAMTSARP
jgi:hypothetical protein